MREFWKSKNASRKFVDLIWKSATKWAVWEPASTAIEVGDYGIVDEETGLFEREGNIFTTTEFADLVKDYAPQVVPGSPASMDDVISISSLNARQLKLDNNLGVDVQLADVAFQGTWKFGKSTGAVLVAHQAHHTILPPKLSIKQLTEHPLLKEKHLVTKITKCPAYALYLSSQGDTELSLALSASVPIAPIPVPLKAGVSNAWQSNHSGGCFRSGYQHNDCFTVLFDLKSCTKSKWGLFRDSREPDLDGVDGLNDTQPPWGMLDDEGNEEDFSIEGWTDETENGYSVCEQTNKL